MTLTAIAGPNPTDAGVRVGVAPVSTGGVGAISCSWDFGDTASETGCTTGHTYTDTGTFTATVTATDEVGVTTTASVTITVNPLPSVDFSFEQAEPMAGEPVNFTSITTGGSGPFSFSWNYGDSRCRNVQRDRHYNRCSERDRNCDSLRGCNAESRR